MSINCDIFSYISVGVVINAILLSFIIIMIIERNK